MFDLNKPGHYKVKIFQEIEDFDPDQYGNKWYNVVFEGGAETYMWLKKDPPEEDKEYYGHFERTKSGKRLRFKTDKLPEGHTSHTQAPGSKVDYEPGTNARWAIGLAYGAFIQVTGSPEGSDGKFSFDAVYTHAAKLVNMFERIKNSGEQLGAEDRDSVPTSLKREEHPAAGYDKLRKTGQQFSQAEISAEYPEDWPNDEG